MAASVVPSPPGVPVSEPAAMPSEIPAKATARSIGRPRALNTSHWAPTLKAT